MLLIIRLKMEENINTNIIGSGIESKRRQHALLPQAGGKGQVSIEYLVLTGFLLIIVGAMIVFSLYSFNESSNLAKADAGITEMITQSNWVASLGDGSKVFFEIEIPEGVQAFQMNNKQIRMVLNTASGDTDIFGYARPDLTPKTFSTNGGRRAFSATFTDGNVVVVEIA